MNIKQARDQAVAKTMQSIRGIEKDMGVNYPALKQIRTELISLTADQNLFPAEDFPLDPTGGDVIYRLSEDNDHRFALYGSVGSEGKSVSPHNHSTWAVIVGVFGDEVNQFYQCTSGGKEPGPATRLWNKREVLLFTMGMAWCSCPTIFTRFKLMMRSRHYIFMPTGSP
jgi:predicted metal-dependent enzyme (double-stranded beta helix superfamily)